MERQRRVCHVLYSGLGGHGSVVFSCLESDRNREFDHTLVFLGVEPVLDGYVDQCQRLAIDYEYVQKSRASDFYTQGTLLRTLRRRKPDVILLHSGYAGLPACCVYRSLYRASRLAYIEHTPNHQKRRIEWLGSALAPWLADRVVYLTEASLDEIRQVIGPCFLTAKATVVANGIDTGFFYPQSSPRAQELLIGMQARMTTGKDHATLIQALDCLRSSRHFPRLRLQLAGTGDTEGELRQLVRRLQLEEKVDFLGFLGEGELRKLLWKLDVYVHSTKGETLSTAILQAQACGLAVIASDVKGVGSSITHDVDGLLVRPGDPQALARGIEHLLEQPEIRTRLGAGALSRISREFTKERMWQAYASICR